MNIKELLRKISKAPDSESIKTLLDQGFSQFVKHDLFTKCTYQDALEITHEEMDSLYAEAYRFYDEDDYVSSADLFRWLVILNPFIFKYWMGLGASLQLIDHKEKALECYAVASLLSTDAAGPHAYACQIYCSLGVIDEAKKAFNLAQEKMKTDPSRNNFRALLQALQQRILQ